MNHYPLYLIVAFDKNYLIGNDLNIPWNYPEDLKHFYNLTNNKTIIMGYRTMESLKKPLKNRNNIVINKNVHGIIIDNGFYHVNSLEKAIYYNSEFFKKDIFIIGGSKIYQEALSKFNFDKLYITKINKSFDGNIYFPSYHLFNKYMVFESKQSLNYPELFYEEWIKKRNE